jgi:hypothetical protein
MLHVWHLLGRGDKELVCVGVETIQQQRFSNALDPAQGQCLVPLVACKVAVVLVLETQHLNQSVEIARTQLTNGIQRFLCLDSTDHVISKLHFERLDAFVDQLVR